MASTFSGCSRLISLNLKSFDFIICIDEQIATTLSNPLIIAKCGTEERQIDVNYYDKSINNWVQIIEGDKDILKKYNAKIDRISEDNIIKVTTRKKSLKKMLKKFKKSIDFKI